MASVASSSSAFVSGLTWEVPLNQEQPAPAKQKKAEEVASRDLVSSALKEVSRANRVGGDQNCKSEGVQNSISREVVLEAENQKLKKENEALRKTLDESFKNQTIRSSAYFNSQEDLKILRGRIAQLNESLDRAREERNEFMACSSRLREERKGLRKHLASQDQEIEQLKKKNNSLNKSLEENCARLPVEVTQDFEDTIRELRMQVNQLEDENAKLKELNRKREEENQSLEKKLSEANRPLPVIMLESQKGSKESKS